MLWYATTLFDTCLTVCEVVIYVPKHKSHSLRQGGSEDGYSGIFARISARCDSFTMRAYLKETMSPEIRQPVTTSYLCSYKSALYLT